MILVKELKQWLDTLPEDDEVYIDENGTTLCAMLECDAYLEVGGDPVDEEDGDESF